MVHPCVPNENGKPGTELHACISVSSTITVCQEAVTPDAIDVVAGATKLCRTCYPKERGKSDPIPVP
jgi:hypothetical protein